MFYEHVKTATPLSSTFLNTHTHRHRAKDSPYQLKWEQQRETEQRWQIGQNKIGK